MIILSETSNFQEGVAHSKYATTPPNSQILELSREELYTCLYNKTLRNYRQSKLKVWKNVCVYIWKRWKTLNVKNLMGQNSAAPCDCSTLFESPNKWLYGHLKIKGKVKLLLYATPSWKSLFHKENMKPTQITYPWL